MKEASMANRIDVPPGPSLNHRILATKLRTRIYPALILWHQRPVPLENPLGKPSSRAGPTALRHETPDELRYSGLAPLAEVDRTPRQAARISEDDHQAPTASTPQADPPLPPDPRTNRPPHDPKDRKAIPPSIPPKQLIITQRAAGLNGARQLDAAPDPLHDVAGHRVAQRLVSRPVRGLVAPPVGHRQRNHQESPAGARTRGGALNRPARGQI